MLVRRAWSILFAVAAGCEIAFPLEAPPPDAPRSDAGIDATTLACPVFGYQPVLNLPSTYRFANLPRTWEQAESACEQDDTTFHITHLFVPNNDAELVTIQNTASSQLLTNTIWVGVARDRTAPSDVKASYIDVEGGFAVDLWAGGQPQVNVGDADGVVISPILKMMNVSHSTLHDFICECDQIQVSHMFVF